MAGPLGGFRGFSPCDDKVHSDQNKTARATTNAFVRDALAYRPRFGITDLVS